MNEGYAKLTNCFHSVREKVDFQPRVALTLGSGLGAFASEIRLHAAIDYADIEGFPVSTVKGHAGRFLFGWMEDVPVVCMQGRVHYYEGYAMSDVVLPIRLMRLLGAELLLLTNAAGGIAQGFGAGDLMLITGQIASFVPSPLLGENFDALGTRFPDMSQIYDADLQRVIQKAAMDCGVDLKTGVYLQTSGPQYESPQEVSMYRLLGADAVGMSTACEAIAANHMGMKIAGISCISNLASGISPNPLTHEEVAAAADAAAPEFTRLVRSAIAGMDAYLTEHAREAV